MNKNIKFLDYLKKKNCTQLQLAKIIGITNITLHSKIHGKSDFTISEIAKIRDYFQMTTEEVEEIFLKY